MKEDKSKYDKFRVMKKKIDNDKKLGIKELKDN